MHKDIKSIGGQSTIGVIVGALLIPIAIYILINTNVGKKTSLKIEDDFIEDPIAGENEYIPSRADLDFSYDGPSDLRRYDVYGVRSKNNPLIRRVYFNPLDVWVGEQQEIVVQVSSVEPVESVSLDLKTDNETSQYQLELIGGNEINGYWSISWPVTDTHLSVYDFNIRAKSGKDESHINLVF